MRSGAFSSSTYTLSLKVALDKAIFKRHHPTVAETEQSQLARLVTGSAPTAGKVLPEYPRLAAEFPDWAKAKYGWLVEAANRYDAKTKKFRDDENFIQRL